MEWSDIFGDIDALVRDSIWFLILVVVMVL